MTIGQMRLRCLSAPGECDSEDDLILALFMPYDVVASRSDNAELNEAAKQFLAEYLVILHRSLSSLRRKDVQHIVAATTSLVAACLRPSADRVAEAEGPIRTVMMRRATDIIARRLGDPTLTPTQLCRELGVSRSRLYRLFEPVGGVTHYIRRQRLQKTQEILADSSDQRTISGIASEWGFPDASAYSRMFRREFGVSPGDAREEGWQGVTHAPLLPANSPTRPTSTTLSNLLLSTY
jgi:AraC-like DNA-binding protein